MSVADASYLRITMNFKIGLEHGILEDYLVDEWLDFIIY